MLLLHVPAMKNQAHLPRTLVLALAAALACSATSAARADAPNAPRETRRPTALNWIVAGALAGVTGVAVSTSLYTAVRSGDCVGEIEPTGRCTERVDFGWRSAIFLSIGLSSLVAATFFAVLQPIRTSITIGASHAVLEFETRF